MSFTRFFHLISYAQYPLVAIGLYFVMVPYIEGMSYVAKHPEVFFSAANKALLFCGLAISFSTLQDTTKTQNKLSRKVWESPRKGRLFIIGMCIFIVFLLAFAVFSYFVTTNDNIKELSLGAFMLAIGMIGMLKAGVEMFENHRRDKNPK